MAVPPWTVWPGALILSSPTLDPGIEERRRGRAILPRSVAWRSLVPDSQADLAVDLRVVCAGHDVPTADVVRHHRATIQILRVREHVEPCAVAGTRRVGSELQRTVNHEASLR